METNVTIKDIARKTKLSIATISRAINPATQHLVQRSTCRRVHAVIKEVGYVPSLPARRLVTGKSNNIVIFFKPEFRSVFYNDYYSKMLAGAMSAIELSAYNLIISLIKDKDGPFNVEMAVRGLDVAGAIVCNFLGAMKVSAKSMLGVDTPILAINQYRQEENPNCFLIDNFRSAYEATSYLIRLGHRRIAFVAGLIAVKDGQDRFGGYKKALENNHIRYDNRLVYQGDFGEKSGAASLDYFFKGKKPAPSAIFFANDIMAIGAMSELKRVGMECPRDVSIVGFDGIDAGRYSAPPLTTIRQPIYEMAQEGVREIINAIENKTVLQGTRYFGAKLIERGSVAPFVEKRIR